MTLRRSQMGGSASASPAAGSWIPMIAMSPGGIHLTQGRARIAAASASPTEIVNAIACVGRRVAPTALRGSRQRAWLSLPNLTQIDTPLVAKALASPRGRRRILTVDRSARHPRPRWMELGEKQARGRWPPRRSQVVHGAHACRVARDGRIEGRPQRFNAPPRRGEDCHSGVTV